MPPFKSSRAPESQAWAKALEKVDGVAASVTAAAGQKVQQALTKGAVPSGTPQSVPQVPPQVGPETVPTSEPAVVPAHNEGSNGPPAVGNEADVNVNRFQLSGFGEDEGSQEQPTVSQSVQQVARQAAQPVVHTAPVPKPSPVNTTPVGRQSSAGRFSRPTMGRQPIDRSRQQSSPQVQQSQVQSSQGPQTVSSQPVRRMVVHYGSQGVVQSQAPVLDRQRGFGRIFDSKRTIAQVIPWSIAGGWDFIEGSGNNNSHGYYARLLLGIPGEIPPKAEDMWPYVSCLGGEEHYVLLGQDPRGNKEILVGHRQNLPTGEKLVPYARSEWAKWIGIQMMEYAESVWGKQWEIWNVGNSGWGLYIVGGACSAYWRSVVSDYYHIEQLVTADGDRSYLIQATHDRPFDSAQRVVTVMEMIKSLGEKMAKSSNAHRPPTST